MPRGRKKQNVLTLEEQLVTVNERIQEVENELKQLRSQRKEIQEKIEEQEKETLFRAVVASGRTVEDVLAILKAQDQNCAISWSDRCFSLRERIFFCSSTTRDTASATFAS